MTSHPPWAASSVTLAHNGTSPDRIETIVSASQHAGLAELFAAGDERSLSQLFAAYGEVVYKLAYAIVRNPEDAEDVVNVTFASAWRQHTRFDASRGPIVAWLSVIARNKAFDIVRARKRRVHHTTRYGVDTHSMHATSSGSRHPSSDAQQQLEAIERCAALRRALLELPPAQRDVIVMAYLGQCSHLDVAARLGVPLGTVKSRARLALRRMRSALEASAVYG